MPAQPTIEQLPAITTKIFVQRNESMISKPVKKSQQTYAIMPHHEDNPAWAVCPFCGKLLVGKNSDFWNRGKKCECGAYVGEEIAQKD